MKLLGSYSFSLILSYICIIVTESRTVISPANADGFVAVAVNTTMDLSCSLSDSNATISDLHLTECVPQSCEILTPYRQTNTTKFYQHTFTEVRPHITLFVCNDVNDSVQLEVIVGYRPEVPDTVNCTSVDQSELNCTWIIPHTTIINSVTSNWTIKYTDGITGYRDCPQRIENEFTIGCIIPAGHDNLMDMFLPSVNYTMVLTQKTIIGEASREYHIPVAQTVKLTPPPMDIKPDRNMINVTLSLPPNYRLSRDYKAMVEYMFTYKPTWSNETKQIKFTSKEETISVSLPKCIPFTDYIVTMKAKPIKSEYWSDLTEKVVQTKPDVPYQRPEISPGLYTVNNFISEGNELYLFYKPLVKRFWNSRQLSINVTVSDQQSNMVYNGMGDVLSAFLLVLFKNTQPKYSATLRFFNNEGLSEVASSLEILNEENKMIVMAEETRMHGYRVSWEVNDSNCSSVTVMWCTRDRSLECKNDVNWKVFKNAGKSVYLSELGNGARKTVGVSFQYKNGTSTGMAFPKCYFYHPNSEPKLAFTSRRGSTGDIFVDLVTPYCQYPSKPELYELFYEEHTDQKRSCPKDFSKTVTVDASYALQTIPLTNVDPFVTYDVCYGVITSNGRQLYSDVQTVKSSEMSNSALNFVLVAGIVCGVILLIVILVAMIKYFETVSNTTSKVIMMMRMQHRGKE